jgi:DNA-directed RNA polymerase subunit RPC12/RpoP
MNKKIETKNRKAAFVELKEFCLFSMGELRKGDFLEVTEWSNSEGYDIHISDVNGEKQFHLTWGQMDALFKCVKSMDESFGEEEEKEGSSITTKTHSGLLSLDEHNSNAWSTQVNMNMYSSEPKRNGIACPKCGNELMDSNPMMTLTSHPAKKNVHCSKCGYTGYRIV